MASSGKVTDTQVAFLVECYLRDSRFHKTLHLFRSEAASILHPLKSIAKSPRSLSSILNEYVILKEQHIAFNHEKSRVDVLFKGLQDILSVYQSGGVEQLNESLGFSSPPAAAPPPSLPQPPSAVSTPAAASETVAMNKEGLSSSSLCKRKSHVSTAVVSDSAKKPRRTAAAKNSSSSSLSSQGILMQSDPNSLPENCKRTSLQPQHHYSPVSEQQKQFVSPVRTNLTDKAPSVSLSSSPDSCSNLQASNADPRTPSPLSATNLSVARQHTGMVQAFEGVTGSASPPSTADLITRKGLRPQNQHPPPYPPLSAAATAYSLRAHKKPDYSCSSASPFTATHSSSDPSKLSSSRRKKGANSKCRLLDFSAASMAKDSQGNSPRNAVDHRLPSTVVVATQVQEIPREASSQCPSPLSSQEQKGLQEPCSVSGLLLSCDAVFFDDLFELEIDTDLISQLEDLQPMSEIHGVCLESASGCSDVSEDAVKSWASASEVSPCRGILTDRANLLSSSGLEAAAGGLQEATMASPSGIKADRVYGEGEATTRGNKENRAPSQQVEAGSPK